MCGIIGYVGNREAAPILIDGLKRLEYRGYDSAGLCISNKGSMKTVKSKGKVSLLEEKISKCPVYGNIGIAHTRWATHGEPSEINAHPHMDSSEEIAIVHNGIIENHGALRRLLEGEGAVFVSETDSEVVAHLIKKFYDGSLEIAVQKALALVEGAFGLAIMSKKEGQIVAARRSSPLVIGVGDGEMFVASDVSAILPYTQKIIRLSDNELAVIGKKTCIVKNFSGKEIAKAVEEANLSVQQIAKGNYKHFMLKEIFEQPESLKSTLAGRVKNGKIKLSIGVNFDFIERVIILGCGTSFHSAMAGKYLIEKIAGMPVEVDYSSEFKYRSTTVNKTDLVVAISQSGETADTLAALRKAKILSAKTLGIVNVAGSTISKEVDSGIYLHCGPEIGVASTKAFTSQVSSLLLLALFIAQEKKIKTPLAKELAELPSKAAEALNCFEKIKSISAKLGNCRQFLYLGRGINFPVALEGALKLKEIAYVSAEGLPAAEMKHGPIALVDENTWSVFLATQNNLLEKNLSNMHEIKARKGKILAITNQNNRAVETLADEVIIVPSVPEELEPIINAIPLQLLAYCIADNKGLDIDKPRNLAKSVTVE